MKNNSVRTIILTLSGVWIYGFLHPVLFPNSALTLILNPFISKLYSTVCHQDPEKLCSFNYHQTYICYRCTGIYLGLFTGILFSYYYSRAIELKYLILTSSLLLADVLLSTLGIYNYSKFFAFITGLFFGISLFLYIQDVILKVFNRKV